MRRDAPVETGRPVRSRVLATIVVPSMVLAPVFTAARALGFVADEPFWVFAVALLAATLAAATGVAWFSSGSNAGWRLWAQIGCRVVPSVFVMYAIGWGPTLAIGLAFVCAHTLATSGSRAIAPCITWCVVSLAAGELAIATGIAPSLVDPPLVHGLAALAGLGLVFTLRHLDDANRQTEAVEAQLRTREERFRALVQNASDAIMVLSADGAVQDVTPAFETVLGYSPQDARQLSVRDLVHEDDYEALRASLSEPPAPGESRRLEVRLRRREGAYRWFDALVTDLTQNPVVGGFVVNLRDVTERKATESALAEVQAAFRYAFEDAPIGVVIADLNGFILRPNRAFARLLDAPSEELVDVSILSLAHPDERLAIQLEHERLLRGEIEVMRREARCIRPDGTTLWVNCSTSVVRDVDGHPLYLIGQMEDVTERRVLSDRLAYEATHDPMTGLANRASFTDQVSRAVTIAGRIGKRVAVMFVDLDHFKVVNDGLGHAVGDELLMAVAYRLRNTLRSSDIVARFGGDEFLILCGELTGPEGALDIAGRVSEALTQPVHLSEGEVFVTASIGIALSEPGDSGETLMRHADAAMYRAKSDGRARIQIFDRRADDGAAATLKTGTALHHALEREELVLHYQPIVELRHGRTVGAEALLRWNHPERGLLLPGEFLPLAEETGLIVPIGEWVLETACLQAAEWRDASEGGEGRRLYVGVNLSPRQLSDPTLSTAIERMLRAHSLDPSLLSFDITEQSLLYDTTSAIRALESLRDLGLHVSVDDFGTGFSSLAHLKRIPIDTLKIDATFVRGVADNPEDMRIVEAVISLAHALGLRTLAEGVETPEQLQCLRAMRCDLAQGYLFGAPQPTANWEAVGETFVPEPAWTTES
jgi:diguanylate cyclase (GGDEF)-like protein/PAS domain S-box-containing protein